MFYRIVITGAESTGKTTLAQALSDHYSEPWTREFVREYVDPLDRKLTVEDLEPIARGQIAIEDEKLEQVRKLIIHDTNLLSSIIYAKHYFETELEWVNQCFRERNYSLYLLCATDIPWKADPGQRESASARDQLQRIFKKQLDSLRLPYTEVRGTNKQRLRQSITAIDTMIGHRTP